MGFDDFFGLASLDLRSVSSAFARKLAVFAKSVMSSTACSSLVLLAPFSIISISLRMIWHSGSLCIGPPMGKAVYYGKTHEKACQVGRDEKRLGKNQVIATKLMVSKDSIDETKITRAMFSTFTP